MKHRGACSAARGPGTVVMELIMIRDRDAVWFAQNASGRVSAAISGHCRSLHGCDSRPIVLFFSGSGILASER